MEIAINNKCKEQYRPNPEKTIRKILNKIPKEYLVGLKEINLS